MDAPIQIAAELARLAQQRASGALEISGSQGGTVFLSGGYLSFAESPIVPDLRSRLISSNRLSAGQWQQIADSGQVNGGIGTLVSREILTTNELRVLLRSIALDALIALAVMPAPTGIRFWPRRSHWVGSLLRLDAASVWAEVGQRAERLAARGIPADARPRWRDLDHPWAVVRDGPWILACQSDGQATVTDLAWRNGFPLCDALDWTGDLVQAGLCSLAVPAALAAPPTPATVTTTAAVPPVPRERRPLHRPGSAGRRTRPGANQDRPGQSPRPPARSAPEDQHAAPGPVNGTVRPAGPDDATVPLPLPHRQPGATLAARPARARPPEVIPGLPTAELAPAQPPQSPHPDLWHRILTGLKRIQ